MEATSLLDWHPLLADRTLDRSPKPRTSGRTMAIDTGLGLHALEDLLATAAPYMDMIKIGFGTSPLYPKQLLRRKVELVRAFGIDIYPGGTFLEAAVSKGIVDEYFRMVKQIGFNAVEISDGIIDLDRDTRSELIITAISEGFKVYTEYGKKGWGSTIRMSDLVETVNEDIRLGAELVTIEGRESGAGVGIFDENGGCRDDQIEQVLSQIPAQHKLLWEAPQKSQQVHLINRLGPTINLGNIAPQDVLSLEALRRGLRADTFFLADEFINREAEAEVEFSLEAEPSLLVNEGTIAVLSEQEGKLNQREVSLSEEYEASAQDIWSETEGEASSELNSEFFNDRDSDVVELFDETQVEASSELDSEFVNDGVNEINDLLGEANAENSSELDSEFVIAGISEEEERLTETKVEDSSELDSEFVIAGISEGDERLGEANVEASSELDSEFVNDGVNEIDDLLGEANAETSTELDSEFVNSGVSEEEERLTETKVEASAELDNEFVNGGVNEIDDLLGEAEFELSSDSQRNLSGHDSLFSDKESLFEDGVLAHADSTNS
ncbi:phosphosulfolactate synthase [Paenibacillus sp. J2TS4]|uniref:phosphosulfolactate synthase n=1 Tax=Paenibacillus sp. J2TS4 TaxID=2807194 RepID=UPI001B07BF2B|nr:phosphosulfolactate synthase [Paenibacillus sp. J2TS4]GIP32259.1 hypothetical protein J2TS4_14690 [Paenibacillus sp. J2TS4]